MAVGRGRAGLASCSSQTRGGIRRRARYIGQPCGRGRVVPLGGAWLARRAPGPRSIGIRAHRPTFDARANRPGETLCQGLGAEAAEASRASFTKTIRRRRRAMKAWFVPPIVIPILIAMSLAGYVSLRAFL